MCTLPSSGPQLGRYLDVERLDKVQAQATKLVPSIRHKEYQRKLVDLGLFSLEQRRLWSLLIENFKIPRGFSGLDQASVLDRTTDWPSWILCYAEISQLFGMCNLCNVLPEAVLNAASVDAFKRRFEKILPGFFLFEVPEVDQPVQPYSWLRLLLIMTISLSYLLIPPSTDRWVRLGSTGMTGDFGSHGSNVAFKLFRIGPLKWSLPTSVPASSAA